MTCGGLANTNALVPGPQLSTPRSIQRSRVRLRARTTYALALALIALEQAACLPLDDLSSYSSAWERAGATSDEAAIDASSGVDDRADGGADASGSDAGPDASSPLGPAPDAGAGAAASDAGARAPSDGGLGVDAAASDAAP